MRGFCRTAGPGPRHVLRDAAPDLRSILYAVDETGHVLECGSMVTHEAWENIDKLYCVRDKGIVGITNDGRVLSDIELF